MAENVGEIIIDLESLAELLQLPDEMRILDVRMQGINRKKTAYIKVKHPDLPVDKIEPTVIIKYKKLKNGTYKRTSWKQKSYRD